MHIQLRQNCADGCIRAISRHRKCHAPGYKYPITSVLALARTPRAALLAHRCDRKAAAQKDLNTLRSISDHFKDKLPYRDSLACIAMPREGASEVCLSISSPQSWSISFSIRFPWLAWSCPTAAKSQDLVPTTDSDLVKKHGIAHSFAHSIFLTEQIYKHIELYQYRISIVRGHALMRSPGNCNSLTR